MHRFAYALAASLLTLPALAAPVDDAIAGLQQEWAQIRYQAPTKEREARFEQLAAKAHQASASFPGRSEPLVWEGIVLSSWAGEKGGLGALSLVKQAKALYEKALQLDAKALDGSAMNSLGVLYYKVPGWPIGFGDDKKALENLKRGLAINPDGIDPNFFYGDYLLRKNDLDGAERALRKALQAPARPGRKLADEGRRGEIGKLLEQIAAKRGK